MSDIKAAMKLIGGVEPTPQQIQRVQAIAHSLDITANDPMLSILIALDCYHGIFSDLPTKAKELGHSAAVSASTRAKLAADLAVKEAVQNLTPEVEKAMGQVVSRVATRQMFQWGAGALAVAAVCIGLTSWFARSSGVEYGKALGYAEAKDEKAAAAWANTPEGKAAYQLGKFGELQNLAQCNGKGWAVEKGVCFVNTASDGIHGWRVR